MKEKNIWKVITYLSLIGIGLASYLFYEYLVPDPFDVCYVSSLVNCAEVTKGSLSTLLGIPVSLIGLIGYIVILLSSLAKNKRLLFAVASFGTLFCLRITYLELFAVKVICPVCLACQVVMLIIFFLSLYLLRAKRG